MGSSAAVTIDAMAAAWLADYALTQLYMADQDQGCCPICCGPCAALVKLHADGVLDEVLRPYMDQFSATDWWDPVLKRLNWYDVQRAWRLTDCHEGNTPDPATT